MHPIVRLGVMFLVILTDKNRTKAFIDKLLIHKIKVYEDGDRYARSHRSTAV